MKTKLSKKEVKPKRSIGRSGLAGTKTFPTLAHIVLSNGLRVDIPKLPTTSSELTTYDHMRIALEYAALATCCLNQLGSHSTPRLADTFNMAPIRLNLEDLLNHLHFAIEGYPSEKESA